MTNSPLYAFRYGTVREMESCLNQIGYKTDISNYKVAKNLSREIPDGVKYFTCRKPHYGFGVHHRPPIGAILVTAKNTILGEL